MQTVSLPLLNIVQDFPWLLEGSPHCLEHLAGCSGVLPFCNFDLSLICKVILIFQINVPKLQDVPTLKGTPGGHLFPLYCYSRGDYFYLFISILFFPTVPIIPSRPVT